ncbi:alpha/beta hydrolase [Nocardioides guangzhouensis]|uniref:Alpha/beta hydrolase n=1 Tax=Nocardioides guangzhouensis TaxID=2497878 RepID=A0A4Q4ZEN6_9ACTN|nr:alpha/beta hydrolase [Nocardioides guangzhouensis]RYP86228.1 alpha/beta hydrolase [Nocardioides guangzhouensis]
MTILGRWTAALVMLLLATACGGAADDDREADDPAPSPTAVPSPAAYSLPGRCTGQGGTGEVAFLPGGDGSWLSTASFGEGDTAAVFVHQTGITGLCGWVPYAEWAGRQGIRAVLVDVCGFGRSQCSDVLADDPAAQMALAVDHARQQGATTVVLVGASMGGALVAGAGEQAGADALVDISGPTDWEGVPSVERAVPAITVPARLVFARADGPEHWRRARAAARGTDVEFVDVPGAGHGYTIVTDGSLVDATITGPGKDLLAWVRQQSAAR